MPTSSIFHSPKFETKEDVERLINAIEESEKASKNEKKHRLMHSDEYGDYFLLDSGKKAIIGNNKNISFR